MRRILCYGDSNTWGFMPGTGTRYDEHTRWTGVLADTLGDGWCIVEEGLNARTTCFDEPYKPFLNGLAGLPMVLYSQKPIDLLVLSLGTNDLKTHTAAQSAAGIGALIDCARAMDVLYPSGQPVFSGEPKILVISPIRISEALSAINPDDMLAGSSAESLRFPAQMRRVCGLKGVPVLDAQTIAEPSGIDGVHMLPEGHRALGLAVAQ